MTETVITESTKIYPRGRGKVLVISEKTIQQKPKKYTKKNPSFLHSIIKSNPESIKVKEYMNDDEIKRIIMFPEGRQLSRDERLDLACSLLITLPYVRNRPDTSGKRIPSLLTQEVRNLCKQKWGRYQRWRNRLS
jgi:hypothetical protein